MTFNRLWAFLAIGLPVLAAIVAPFPSVDLTYHLRAGGDILDVHALPAVDTYTFTVAGRPWLDQQWLAQVVLAAFYRLGGWTGLVILRAGLVGIAFGLLFDLCFRRGGSIRLAAWLTLAAFVTAAVTLGLRPQLFGVTLFAGSLWLVARRREHPRLVWFVPVLAAVWTNVHGTVVLALALVGLALIDDLVARRHWTLTLGLLIATGLATLLNPFGWGVWTYAVRIATNSVITKRITEWQPTSPLTAEGAVFYASLAAVGVVFAVAWRRGGPPWLALLWIVPFAVLGAWAVRGLAWWPFVGAATVATLHPERAATRSGPRPETHAVRRINAAIAVALVVIAVLALPSWRPMDRGLRAPVLVVGTAPSGITGALRGIVKPGDRIVAPQPWGSWFEFAFPNATVAVDSRIELFPDDVWTAFDEFESGQRASDGAATAWRPTIVVAATAQSDLVESLLATGWRKQFADVDGTVLTH